MLLLFFTQLHIGYIPQSIVNEVMFNPIRSHQLLSCFPDMVMFTQNDIKTRVRLMIAVWFTPHVAVTVVYPFISHVKC